MISLILYFFIILLVINTNLSESMSIAADYTGKLFSRIGDLIVLIIISIIPIVNLLAWGYLGRVIKEGKASNEPPKVEKFGDMFIGGLKVLGVLLIWAIPTVIIISLLAVTIILPIIGYVAISQYPVGNWTMFEQMMQYGNWTNFGQMMQSGYWSNFGALALAMIPIILLIAIVVFIIGIFALMGIVHMFKTGSFTKAFALGEIFHIISKISFLRYVALLIIAFILGTIIGIFEMIPIIGWVIGAFLSLLLGIFIARDLGLLYDDATGGTPETAQSATFQAPPPPPMMPIGVTGEQVITATSTAQTKTIYCSDCGALNQIESKFCYKCGKPLLRG